jgi:osmotically-inducible protein OsmY
MKAAVFFLLIGAILGAIGWRYYQRAQHPTLTQQAENLAGQARVAAGDTKQAVVAKAEDWKLTPDNIRGELAQSGRVVRSKARDMGDSIADARIVAVIKGKFVVDNNLSVLAISVACTDGSVTLTGSATSPENIGRAVTLALETHGVHHVVSQLVVRS